jgi:hypothetical protein
MSASGDPGDAFGGHALCLAARDGQAPPALPAEQPAAPTHHTAFCCLWHSLPALQPLAGAPSKPVAYAGAATGTDGDEPFIPGPQHSPANARAPPALA